MELKTILRGVLALVVSAGVLCAQEVPQFSINGKVVDGVTREALPNVNVYLANTMIGTTTNPQGEFLIRTVPAGSYDLVVSMVGYGRQILNIRLFEPLQKPLDIRLLEQPFETVPVEVLARDQSEWRKGLRLFTDYLFGKTKNAGDCRIVNPEVLDFKEGMGSGELQASAREPLLIENKALGYRLELILQIFSVEETAFKYGGVTRFEELKATDGNEAERWKKNRLRSYRGSLPHFLLALLKNNLDEEGFIVLSTKELPFRHPRIPFRETIKPDDIIEPGEFPFERLLRFRDYLEIRYRHEPPEPGFYDFWTAQQIGSGMRTILNRFHGFLWMGRSCA